MITRHSASVVAALLFVVTSMVSVGVSAQSLGDIPASQRVFDVRLTCLESIPASQYTFNINPEPLIG